MGTWRIACSAAVLAIGLAPTAHADEMNKLTYLTFSGPVDVPGMTLPAGTYRFELADPDTGRRVIRVADKEGTKHYGMFISIPNERMKPTDDPVVMFKETAAGAPPAIQVWFYPGESTGYEFVYPHDQALKLAKATHQPVLSYTDNSTASTAEADRMSSMKNAEVTRIDETDKAVAADAGANSGAASPTRPAAATAQPSTAPPSSTASEPSTAAGTRSAAAQPTSTSAQPSTTPAQPSTASAQPTSTSAQPSTASAQPTTAARSTAAATTGTRQQAAPTTARRNNGSTAVGTSGTTAQNAAPAPGRKQLPRTASTLPLMELLTALMLAGGFGAHAARKSMQA